MNKMNEKVMNVLLDSVLIFISAFGIFLFDTPLLEGFYVILLAVFSAFWTRDMIAVKEEENDKGN